jgi:hypothetical protein
MGKIIVKEATKLLRRWSKTPGQIERVCQRKKARANPMKKRTMNEPKSP